MIALLNNSQYFMDGCESVGEFLIAYMEYIGCSNEKAFRILVNSNEMSTKELIEYINNNVYSYDDKILEIYEVGKKLY